MCVILDHRQLENPWRWVLETSKACDELVHTCCICRSWDSQCLRPSYKLGLRTRASCKPDQLTTSFKHTVMHPKRITNIPTLCMDDGTRPRRSAFIVAIQREFESTTAVMAPIAASGL
mmetsp:Transcript_63634/g.110904  ORF Transcript_63634/g.110904 Transcript_63634/m.110904 type:complete len:118 (-) Transcript_63634:1282-1635(-)